MYLSLKNTPTSERGTRPRGIRTVSSAVASLGVVSMLTDISSESVTAVLPLYVTSALGLSMVAYGFLDGIYQGISALVRIAGGYTSDRLDQPKWVAFVGYAIAAAARVGLLFAAGFGALTAVISADRIGKGIRTAPRDSVITAASRPENLGTSFGVHRTLDNIGAALGPLIAFLILLIIPDGFTTVFAASLAFALIGVVVLGLLVPNVRRRDLTDSAESGSVGSGLAGAGDVAGPEAGAVPDPAASGTAKTKAPGLRAVLTGPMRRVLAAAGVLGLLTIGDGFVYLVLQARSDFAAAWFPLLYVGTNVAFLALAIPLGRLSDRVGRGRVFVLGHLGLLAAYVTAALPVAGVPSTLACLVFLGAFYAATDGVLAALAAQLSTPETHGTGIAAAQTVVAVTRFLAATGFGLLWFAVGRTVSLVVVAAALAVAIPLVAWLLREHLRAPVVS